MCHSKQYKIGDKVCIVKRATCFGLAWPKAMDRTIGSVVTICCKSLNVPDAYYVDEEQWAYLAESFALCHPQESNGQLLFDFISE